MSRQIYRGDQKAFYFDHLALKLSLKILQDGTEYKMYSHWEQLIVLLPLVNSEDYHLLQRAIREVTEINNNLKSLYIPELDAERFFQEFNEKNIVLDAFGRYPTRNLVLGRFNSPTETEYLQQK